MIVAETDSPTSRTCQIGIQSGAAQCAGQQHGQRRSWPSPPCEAPCCEQLQTIISSRRHEYLHRWTGAIRCRHCPRGRGARRHVRLPCPDKCPHVYAPPRGPAPPAPFSVSWEDPRNEASQGGVGGRGPSTLATAQPGAAIAPRCKVVAFQYETAGGKAPNTCVLAPDVFESEHRVNGARIPRSKFAPC